MAGEPIDDVQARQDAEHLKLLSIFHYVVAAMTGLFACFPIIHFVVGAALAFGLFPEGKANEVPPPALMGWFFMLVAGSMIALGWTLAICGAAAARFLAKRRNYLFCLVYAGVISAMCMPVGTVLGVFTILVLIRPSVKQAFEQSR